MAAVTTARLLAPLLVVAVVAAPASAGSAKERLPTPKGGALVPSADGVVLGETKRAAIASKWGAPTLCRNSGPGRLEDDWRCIWQIGSAEQDYPTPPRAGALVDWVDVKFAPGPASRSERPSSRRTGTGAA
jgi:hypothetical protein